MLIFELNSCVPREELVFFLGVGVGLGVGWWVSNDWCITQAMMISRFESVNTKYKEAGVGWGRARPSRETLLHAFFVFRLIEKFFEAADFTSTL